MASRMGDAPNGNVLQRKSPNSRRVLRAGGVLAGFATLMIAGATAAGGTLIALLVASPILLFFSPVLIPLAILAALTVGGVISFVVFISAAAWLYKYARGRHPFGSHQVDVAKTRIVHTASEMRKRAGEVGSNVARYLQSKAAA